MKTAGVVGEPPLGLGKVQAGTEAKMVRTQVTMQVIFRWGCTQHQKFRQGVDDGQAPVNSQQDDEEDLLYYKPRKKNPESNLHTASPKIQSSFSL